MEMCDCSREDAEKAMKMAGGNEDEAANIIFDGRLHDDEIAQVAQAEASTAFAASLSQSRRSVASADSSSAPSPRVAKKL